MATEMCGSGARTGRPKTSPAFIVAEVGITRRSTADRRIAEVAGPRVAFHMSVSGSLVVIPRRLVRAMKRGQHG